MKTTVKKEEKSQVKLTVTLDENEMGAIIKDVEKSFMREAQIPGFRKGKVPLQLIRKEFAEGLKREIEVSMFRQNYPEAVKAENINEVALVDINDISYDQTGGAFTAVIDVKPEFKLPAYKGLKIEFKDATVDDKAVQEQMERLRAAYAKYEDAKEGEAVAEGDFVQIDYEGMIGDKKILEINPDAKIVAEGKGFWTQVEEGRFLPEILDAIKGMKAGETKEGIEAKFDKESAPEGLKGEKSTYKVTLTSFRRRILPTDAEFAEKAKEESYEKLTASIRERMQKNATDQEAARREQEAIDLLMKKVDFEVPQSQVRRAMDGYLQELLERARYSGLNAEYFEQNKEKIMKDAEEASVKQVRLWYVLEAIAAEEKIEAEDGKTGEKVLDLILANAKH